MNEYGIFNDEGLLEGDFYSEASATAMMNCYYADDDAHVSAICPDHQGHEKDFCEECNAE